MKDYVVRVRQGHVSTDVRVAGTDPVGAMAFIDSHRVYFNLKDSAPIKFLSVKERGRTVWMPAARIEEIHEEEKAHLARVGRRVRRWLRAWLHAWLEAHPYAASIKVTVDENDEYPRLADVWVDVEVGTAEEGNDPPVFDDEEAAQEFLWKWGHYLQKGLDWGDWVRVERGGKVYRNKRKEKAESVS